MVAVGGEKAPRFSFRLGGKTKMRGGGGSGTEKEKPFGYFGSSGTLPYLLSNHGSHTFFPSCFLSFFPGDGHPLEKLSDSDAKVPGREGTEMLWTTYCASQLRNPAMIRFPLKMPNNGMVFLPQRLPIDLGPSNNLALRPPTIGGASSGFRPLRLLFPLELTVARAKPQPRQDTWGRRTGGSPARGQVSHDQNPVQKWCTQNHASRTKKAAAAIVPYQPSSIRASIVAQVALLRPFCQRPASSLLGLNGERIARSWKEWLSKERKGAKNLTGLSHIVPICLQRTLVSTTSPLNFGPGAGTPSPTVRSTPSKSGCSPSIFSEIRAVGQKYVPKMGCPGKWKHGPKPAVVILVASF